jgi:3'-phosphoadenosine 5'-phosphosulfate sulfotransferase (PAPS reductase)/FAD synthetase
MTFFSRLLHLDRLESEAIFILREAAAQSRNPALLFSGGKDSAVLLHLALKAFRPEKLPFPLLHSTQVIILRALRSSAIKLPRVWVSA